MAAGGHPADAGVGRKLERVMTAGDMRQPAHWRHPSGAMTPGSPMNYQPPIVDGTPYKADGTPGDLCAGWVALRLKAMQPATGRRT